MSPSKNNPDPGHEGRGQRILDILDACLQRRTAGESLTDAEIIAEHPELLPELEERLAALRLIERAGRAADGAAGPPDSPGEGSSSAMGLPPDHIEGHCPHCGAHWRIRARHAGRKARCRGCGGEFTAGPGSLSGAGARAPASDAAAAEKSPAATEGEVAAGIPGYAIEGELGQGGMGKVYRARELATKRTVALKVMLAGRHADARQRRRFEREVEIAAALQHPHIARLYASGLHEGRHWFAMEYVEGVTLGAYVEREHPALVELLALFARICHAVNHAHQRGIMHRDLKPGNILVDERAQPHVLDFGLAKLADQMAGGHEDSISLVGEVAGTPAYMSPEQTKGDPSRIDIRSDVYSLGVILYRLLTGRSPYDEPRASARADPPKARTLPELLRAINEAEPPPPRRVDKEIPSEVEAITLKALRKDPAERYQTAGELARDVEAYLAGDVVTAKRGSGWYTLRKTALRYKRLAGAIAAVVVLSLGLGLTMSALFAKKVIEYRDVVREVQVVREREAARRNPAVEQEIRRLAEHFFAACRPDPRGDYERFAELLAKDVLAVGPWGYAPLGGRDALLRWHKQDRPKQSVPFENYDLTYDVESVRVLGDAAVVFGKAHFGGKLKSGNEGRAANWETLVFRREPAGWQIVHEQSTPLQPDLLQAFAALRALREGRPLYVDAKARGADTGGTWTDAYSSLQDALAISLPGHEIWVAAGTYKPAGPGGERTASFRLKSGVKLYGGFAGNETQREQRDPQKNETILSGDLNGDDGPEFANNGDNCYHVVIASGCDATAVLDGFTMTAGNADGEEMHCRGGGLYSEHGSPTIDKCTFEWNRATGRIAADGGGALCNTDGSNPIISDCTFVRNTSSIDGGAVINREGSAPVLIRCGFIENRARDGGGMYNNRSSPMLMSCKFLGNVGGARGGAVRNLSESSSVFVGCVFSGNTTEQEHGAVMHNHSADVTLINCTLANNRAAGTGGGIINTQDSKPILMNCILWGNSDSEGNAPETQFETTPGTVITSCCIQGWGSEQGGQNTIDGDPLFVDADGPDNIPGTEDDDLRLRPGSPCIDRGDKAALPPDTADLDGDGDTAEPIPFDLAGKPRAVNDAVDMGAYEYQGLETAEQWIDLFNGRDLAGWSCVPGSWAVENGTLVCKGGGDLWTDETFDDFALELEFKLPPEGNSGVFLRTGDVNDPVQTSIEVQLLDSHGKRVPDKHDCGAIYDCLAPNKNVARRAGEWNRLGITCDGGRIGVVLNGQPVIDMNLDEWTTPRANPDGSPNKFDRAIKDMPRAGRIGLQDHNTPVWFRNVRVKRLRPAGANAAFKKYGFLTPDGRTVYPPQPNPAQPVNYIAWINETLGAGIKDNAADGYWAAAGSLKNPDASVGNIDDFPYRDPEKVARWLAPQQVALERVRQASKSPRCFFAWPDYSALPDARSRLDHSLWGSMESGNLNWPILKVLSPLTVDARLSWQRGETERLLEDALSILRVGRHLEDNYPRLVLPQFIQGWCCGHGHMFLLAAVHLSSNRASLCRRLMPEVERADPDPGSVQPFGDAILRLMLWDLCQRLFEPGTQAGTWEVRIEPRLGDLGKLDDTTRAKLARIGFEATLRDMNGNFDELLRLLKTQYRDAESARSAVESFTHKWNSTENPLLLELVEAAPALHLLHTQLLSSHRGTHLVLRVFAHQADTGSLPDSLEALSGPDVDKLRIDPFGCRNFVYKRTDDGFVLYSVGADYEDDGGRHEPQGVTGDYVFWPVQREKP